MLYQYCKTALVQIGKKLFIWDNDGGCEFTNEFTHDDVIKWKHSALLALCAGNSPVPGEFPSQRPVTRSFDVFLDLRPNKRSKQWWGWCFETLSSPLWRHCNDKKIYAFGSLRQESFTLNTSVKGSFSPKPKTHKHSTHLSKQFAWYCY